MKDIEYKMYCDCSDPWHFLWFGFSTKNPWTNKEAIGQPELWIRGEFFHGTLWRRIKNAIRYIIRGDYSSQVDLVFFGESKIKELNKFAEDCLNKVKMEQKNGRG